MDKYEYHDWLMENYYDLFCQLDDVSKTLCCSVMDLIDRYKIRDKYPCAD